ncbi:4Fe-4S dicluster domain-containing protein [Candidatus Fermentibacteria bacterium]|nr:4Fe-4S dicluster domain-containing protein [Candidatus Fermentibacteria bacterium]
MAKPSLLGPLRVIKYLFKKPKTLRYPFELKEPARRYRGFHLNDWDQCTGCGNCADICPNDAIEMVERPEIAPDPGEKNERPRLDYGRCCFCGLCVDICPPGSLRLSRDYFHIHFDTSTFVFTPRDEKTDDETFLPAEKYSVLKASLAHRKRDYQGFEPEIDYALFDPDRVEMPEVPPEERKLSFVEQMLGYDREQAVREAERCLECALCEDACPAHLKISDYIEAVYEDSPEDSLRTIYEDNPIPAICGRICMKHCEDACSLSIRGEPLAIRWLKRFVSDTVRNYRDALEQSPGEPTGKRIAVIGAGPGGLSTAYFLRLLGHEVVVFDELSGGGGMLRVGPPRYRLPEEAIDKDVEYIASLGVDFRFQTRVGRDVEFEELRDEFDAVFLGIGLTVSRSTRVENADRCQLALPFLAKNKTEEKCEVPEEVIVIGGGNVAMDVAREALRLQHIRYPGKRTVTRTVSLEDWDEIPATEEEIEEAREEGVEFNPAWGPKRVVLDDQGNIKGLLCMKVNSVFDEEGRFAPTFHEDQEMFLEGRMIIEAIGQGADFSFLPKEVMERIEFTEARKVRVNENGMTTVPGIFAGGDIVNVNLDAVTAIADAKAASEGIDQWLSGGEG